MWGGPIKLSGEFPKMQLMEIMLLKYCSVSFGLLFGISLRNLISLSSNPNIWKPQNSNKVLENHFKKGTFGGIFKSCATVWIWFEKWMILWSEESQNWRLKSPIIRGNFQTKKSRLSHYANSSWFPVDRKWVSHSSNFMKQSRCCWYYSIPEKHTKAALCSIFQNDFITDSWEPQICLLLRPLIVLLLDWLTAVAFLEAKQLSTRDNFQTKSELESVSNSYKNDDDLKFSSKI